MTKFTISQLQAATIELRARTDKAGSATYRLAFDELNRRMGDEAFDAWCEAQGW